tara:strand:- start:196 stop:423 length:228 start_codon:yes stop_codon:yes gene_type:complete
MLEKLLDKINLWYIIFPQIFFLTYKNGALKWLFIPACLVFFLYNLLTFCIYWGIIILTFGVFFIYEKLKNIMKQL